MCFLAIKSQCMLDGMLAQHQSTTFRATDVVGARSDSGNELAFCQTPAIDICDGKVDKIKSPYLLWRLIWLSTVITAWVARGRLGI